MSQELKLKARGLYTQPNQLSLPEGALVTAENVVIRREDIIEPIRGYSKYATETADRIFSYNGTLLLHTTADAIKYDNGSGTFTAVSGTYGHPDDSTAKMRAAEASGNFYFTTDAGVYRMDSTSATPALSGAIKAPGFERDQRVATSTAGNASLTSNVVTVNTSAAHGFYVGQVITQTSATEGAQYLAGNHTIASVPSSTSFTYAETAADDAGNANPHTYRPAALVTAGGFLTDGNQVAYRVVFNCKDSNNAVKLGAASPRIIIANATGTPGWVSTEAKNVVVRVFVPSDVKNTHTVQLYRSAQVSTSTEPSDEMNLVYESLVTDTEISQGWLDITDIVPDAIRVGQTIYTAPSQEGLAESNDRPPLAKDIALFDGKMHYANVTGLHRLVLTILGVGGTNGIQNGELLAIDGQVFTATTSTPSSATDFYLDTSGSTAINIRNTALNLCAAINRDNTTGSRAFYISTPDGTPGQILLERRTLGGSAFYPYTTGKRQAWSPYLNALSVSGSLSRTSNVVTFTIGVGTHNFRVGESVTLDNPTGTFGGGPHIITAVTSTTFTYSETAANASTTLREFSQTYLTSSSSDSAPHRVYESKVGQPEAVPLLSYTDLGSKGADILRVVPLRDSIFAFKEDGVWRKPAGGSWALFDPTVVLVAPDSAVTLGNQIYALTNQGVVRLSDTGVEVVSRPIEYSLQKLAAADLTDYKNRSFGIAYESDHYYELRTISSSSDTICTKGWLYNAALDLWTTDTINAHHGLVSPSDDKRYTVGATTISKERKGFAYTDYQGHSSTVTMNTNNNPTYTLDSATGVSVNDVISVGSAYGRVTAVNGNDVTFNTSDAPAFFDDYLGNPCDLYTHIPSTVQWAPIVVGNPGLMKKFRESNFHFGNAHFVQATVSHSTELITTVATTDVDGSSAVGQQSTVMSTWGGTEKPFNLRLVVPQEMRRGAILNLKWYIAQPLAVWNISGVSILFEPGSARVAR